MRKHSVTFRSIIAIVLLVLTLNGCAIRSTTHNFEDDSAGKTAKAFLPQTDKYDTIAEVVFEHVEKSTIFGFAEEFYYYKATFHDKSDYEQAKSIYLKKYKDTNLYSNPYYWVSKSCYTVNNAEVHIINLDYLQDYEEKYLPVIIYNDEKCKIQFIYLFTTDSTIESVEDLLGPHGLTPYDDLYD